ncbi:Aste57867_16054 [Aphanomyces stellatus]|uniref:Aste57867_16054 protein n=1 Tax=Aphanomyces stellatus TaxID=120398 RepID=A0A485L7S0_9STRA|nr:hypothetical protein As57867_015998 [Aphanomyces stellatus]VFT92838.1 Aste57867_16054 [Aphanomyces stellatus]
MMVTDIKDHSPGYYAGLTPGTLISKMDGGVLDPTKMATRLANSTRLVERLTICQRKSDSKHWSARNTAAHQTIKTWNGAEWRTNE